jgi:hypothetical protein
MNGSPLLRSFCARLTAFLLGVNLLLISSTPVFGLRASNQGSEISYICSCATSRGGGGAFATFLSDPLGAVSYQLDLQWDHTVLQFDSLEFVSPYVQSTPPDLTNVGLGILRDIAGMSSIFPPPLSEADIYKVNFVELNPAAPTGLIQSASSNDFIMSYDSNTGQTTRIEPNQIVGCPEPRTFVLLTMALAIVVSSRRASRAVQCPGLLLTIEAQNSTQL